MHHKVWALNGGKKRVTIRVRQIQTDKLSLAGNPVVPILPFVRLDRLVIQNTIVPRRL